MTYRLRLLGPFTLVAPGGVQLDLPSKKGQVLVAALALAGGESVPRTRLTGLLWGDRGEEQARNSLRQTLTALRKAFAGQADFPFRITESEAATDPDLIPADTDTLVGGDDIGAQDLLSLSTGDFLEGLSLPDPAIETWLREQRRRLNALRVDLFSGAATAALDADDWAGARSLATRTLELDPLQEQAHRCLMLGHSRAGDRTSALRQYEICRQVLHDELGVEPDDATEALHQMILGGAASRPATSPIARAAADDAGVLPPARTVVAILPFANLSAGAELDFFVEGITEDLITDLSRYRDLTVFAHRAAQGDTSRNGREPVRVPGADFFVEGSIRTAGNHVRASVKLVDAETGANAWAERFDREMADILDVQDEIVSAIVARLALGLEGAAGEKRLRRATHSGDAYAWFLQARTAWRNGDARLAKDCLERAVGIDSRYARALVLLGHVVAFDNFIQEFGLAEDEAVRRAQALTEQALGLDKSDPFVLHRAAMVYLMLGEPRIGLQYAEAARQLNARDGEILVAHGMTVACCGEASRGVALMERAVSLEPRLSPSFHASLSDGYFLLGDYEASLRALDRVLDPPYYISLCRVASLGWLGRLDEARKIVAAAPAGFDKERFVRAFARICLRPEDAERWVEGFRLGGIEEARPRDLAT